MTKPLNLGNDEVWRSLQRLLCEGLTILTPDVALNAAHCTKSGISTVVPPNLDSYSFMLAPISNTKPDVDTEYKNEGTL